MKKATAAILSVPVLQVILWWIYSERKASRGLPTESEAMEYFESLMKKAGNEGLVEGFNLSEIASDELRLQLYELENSADAPTAVFIHGTSVYAMFYAELLHGLHKSGFNVIAFDCRGHGLSEGRRGSYTIESLVRDSMNVVSYAIDKYGDNVALIGSSQGGVVALHAALADERLKCAICHNILLSDEEDNYRLTRFPRTYKQVAKFIGVARLLPSELRVPVRAYLDLAKEKSKLVGDLKEFLRDDPVAVSAISLSAFVSLSATKPARRPDEAVVPIMVIHSELDNIFPEDYIKRVFERLSCEKKLIVYRGLPHLLMTECVDEVLPDIKAWINHHCGA